MKLFKSKQKQGFTLVEILLVVGFIALAGIGIYTIYSKVQVSNQANTESRNLDTLRAGIKSLYGGRPNFLGVTATVANQSRITPDSMRDPLTPTVITNSFGGQVTLAAASFGTGSNNVFNITYTEVPSAVCSKLVTSAGVQFNNITVGGVEVKKFGINDPIDVVAAAEECNKLPANTIVFSSL